MTERGIVIEKFVITKTDKKYILKTSSLGEGDDKIYRIPRFDKKIKTDTTPYNSFNELIEALKEKKNKKIKYFTKALW